MRKRTGLQKVDNPKGAFPVSSGVVNEQSGRHQKIAGKKNPGSLVVKRHVSLIVSGRRNYVHSSATQIQVGNSVGPVSETEERSNSIEIYGHDLNRSQRRELRIAGAMIHVSMGMRHEEWELFIPYLARVPRSSSQVASLSGPRQRRYRLGELCRSR
jgi:hypothetical protein